MYMAEQYCSGERCKLEHAVIKIPKLSTVRNIFKYTGKNYSKKVTLGTTSINTFTAVSNVPNFMDQHGPSIQDLGS